MEIWSIRNLSEYRERYDLAMERVGEIAGEKTASDEQANVCFKDFFGKAAAFLLKIKKLVRLQEEDFFTNPAVTIEEHAKLNRFLYEDVLQEGYDSCYANPVYASGQYGKEAGGFLAAVYTELVGMIRYAFDYRYDNITIFTELFLELYTIAESEQKPLEGMKDAFYWFMSDYADVLVPQRIREMLDPKEGYMVSFLEGEDLEDLRYLYRMGEYIDESELQLAAYLNSLPEETIEKMAENYVEGFLRGYEVYRIPLTGKKTVDIRFAVGMERLVAAGFQKLRAHGLTPVCYPRAVCSLNKRQHRRIGYASVGPNRQFDYDHRFDDAIYLDKKYKERRLEVVKAAYEANRDLAAAYAGPILIEGFGMQQEKVFRRDDCIYYTDAQEKMNAGLRLEIAELTDAYIPEEKISFCIVSYPVPEIGPDFEQIFHETIKVNALDVDAYRQIQQHLIDALDQGYKVHVVGKGQNRTDIEVALWDCDPETETKFENCLADVNIPLGEVFTSPKLTGTNGVLHVSRVFLNGMEYKDLEMTFADGRVSAYSCTNFETEEENRAYIKENILYNHDWLPLGEFAIGTNTTAYAMAVKYRIFDKLDILIAEKTGPHFAVGDTCYSFCEERKVYNPDGKEIIARDNEVVRQRSEDISKAYFSCHTDITIPYDELELIEVLCTDGERIPLIRDGRFVLPGTELLNEALDGIEW